MVELPVDPNQPPTPKKNKQGLSLRAQALSLLARREYVPGAPAARIGRSVGRLLAFIPLVDAVALALVGAWPPALGCALMIPLARWAQRRVAPLMSDRLPVDYLPAVPPRFQPRAPSP